MGIISWVIVVLLIVGTVFGLFKGAGKSHPFLISLVCGLALGYFAGIPLARAVMSTSLGTETLTGFYESYLSDSGVFSTSLAGLDLSTKQSLIGEGLSSMGFPSFVQGFFTSNAYLLDGTVAEAIASSFAYLTLVAIFFVLFFIIVFILLAFIINKFKELIFGDKGKGVLGRIFGAVKGFIKVALLVFVAMVVIVLIDQLLVYFGNNTLHDFLIEDLDLDSSGYSIGRLFYDSVNMFFNWITIGD